MIRRANASTTQGMLRRPRLNSLIRDGLEHPLLVILAGPGYGKTQAMSGYLAESAANALWLRLTKLDNLPSHFWNHVIQAFRPQYPDLSNRLNLLGFPDSLSGFDAFIQLLTTHVTEQKPFIWVFDDFGAINNEHIKRFFQTLVEVELDRLSLVLLSNELSSTDSIAFFSSRRFLILGDDLRFTRSEIEALYQMYDLPLDPDELGRIEQHTDGWALALHLLVQHGGRIPNIRLLDETTITRLFEARFFATYTKPYQLLLVRLALLNRFTRKLAIDLYDGNPVELEGLEGLEGMKNHPFLIREPGTDWLFWHHLYHLFLLKKQYLLTEADQRVSWQKAARHYADADYMLEAITCYSKCEDHARMLSAISVFARKLHNINEKDAGFFLEHIDLLTPQEMNAFPLADYLRANIYMKKICNLLKS